MNYPTTPLGIIGLIVLGLLGIAFCVKVLIPILFHFL